MGLIGILKNEVKAAVGYQQSFTELLASNDVTRAISMMRDRSVEAKRNLHFYDIQHHEVMKRKDKAVMDQKGNFVRWAKKNKIPIPYQMYINEISLVFLYGRPVRWSQLSKGTDYAYDKFQEMMASTRFDAAVREAKRAAGAEGVSAILYHTYKNKEGKPDLLLNVLSQRNNDDIYTVKDQYKRLTAFAWGYTLTEAGNNSVYHLDVYTADTIYRAKRASVGWEVTVTKNPVGKIPVLLFEQEPEAAPVQPMIDRTEQMESVDADVNDRFANPAMVATTEILNSLPKAEEEAKLFILKGGGDVRYLTWDQASESKKNQFERLEKHIMSKSFTPDIDLNNTKSLGNLSAKAIKKVMLLAVIKAEKHKETHDAYMDRHFSIMMAIQGNVIDYANRSQYMALRAGHEFQEPFGDDMSEMLADVSKQFNDGAMSRETYVEMSYLIKDTKTELARLQAEEDAALERQKELNVMDVFGQAE